MVWIKHELSFPPVSAAQSRKSTLSLCLPAVSVGVFWWAEKKMEKNVLEKMGFGQVNNMTPFDVMV